LKRSSRTRALIAAATALSLSLSCGQANDEASSSRAGSAGTGAAGMPPAVGGASSGASGAAGTSAGAPGAGGAGGMAAGAGAGGAASGAGGGAGDSGGLGATAGMAAAGGTAGGAGAEVAGSAGTAGVGPGTLTLTGLAIEPNPRMTISCFVSWTTTEPATSIVEFGQGGYEYRITHSELVTDHRVLVIGMNAQKSYQVRAVSTNAQGMGSAEGTFATGMLPAQVPAGTLTVSDFAKSQPGWTLTNIQAALNVPARIVMYDQNGLPVWYFIHGTAGDSRGDVSADLLPSGVLVGPTSGEPARLVDLSGEVIWQGPPNSQDQLMSHFVIATSTGNYVLNREIDKSVTNGSTRIDDQRLEEITPELDVVWSWSLFDHIPPSGSKEELCHGNKLQLDEPGGFLYYNCRWVGLFKIEKSTGDILWRLGGTYDETSLGPGDFTFNPPASKFSDAHEPDLKSDGRLILYDNGGFMAGGGGQTFHSRVLEYEIDQVSMTATRVWEFPGDFDVDPWYRNNWYSASFPQR
jgi:hypothetical protein